jgi:hypothetical protein
MERSGIGWREFRGDLNLLQHGTDPILAPRNVSSGHAAQQRRSGSLRPAFQQPGELDISQRIRRHNRRGKFF